MKSRWLDDTTPMGFDVSTTAEVFIAGSGSQDGLSSETHLPELILGLKDIFRSLKNKIKPIY
jgi:hypothetical protein